MEENQTTFSRQESLQRIEGGGGSKLPLFLVPIVIIVLVGGILFFRSRQQSEEVTVFTITPTPTIVPTSTPTPQPTSTPTPEKKATPTPTKKPAATPIPQRSATTAAELKRQSISVQVLNGSGVSGAAQKTADYLASFYYTVSATGNADNYDYEKTVIETKKETDLALLKTDLEAQYAIGTASATLSSDSAYDAVIIIGKK